MGQGRNTDGTEKAQGQDKEEENGTIMGQGRDRDGTGADYGRYREGTGTQQDGKGTGF
jgi:hypothetical protein